MGSTSEDVTMAEADMETDVVMEGTEEPSKESNTSAAAEFPLLLIQQRNAGDMSRKGAAAGGAGGHMGSGWDIILPKGWGMPLWVSLIHAGCRVIGLRDIRKLCHEMGRPCFPFDYPDCNAYEQWSLAESKQLMDVYNRKPPGKRVNFSKLSVSFPFSSPWQSLVTFWCPSLNKESALLSVLRGYDLLRFQESLSQLQYVERDTVIKGLTESSWAVPSEYEELASKLVMVRLEMEAAGTVDSFSMLSLPTNSHLEALRAFRSGQSSSQISDAMKEIERPPANKSRDYMWSLTGHSLPVPLVGFVTSAGHSYALGKGTALAFCPVAALVALAQSSPR